DSGILESLSKRTGSIRNRKSSKEIETETSLSQGLDQLSSARFSKSPAFTKTSSIDRLRTSGGSRIQTPGSLRSRVSTGRTPLSLNASSARGGLNPTTIVAVVEGRGQARGEVGIAAIDLHSTHLTLAQFSDMHTYTRTITKLSIFNPLEV
ncbi:unnamed protein product, partial [Meganyctiphanes norvegica]